MSKVAFWGGSLLADDELVGVLHEIGAFLLEELAALIEELEGILLEELEFACTSLELVSGPLEELAGVSLEEFGTGLLEELGTGSLDGLETDSLSQLIQQRAALERSSFPKSLWMLLFIVFSFRNVLFKRIASGGVAVDFLKGSLICMALRKVIIYERFNVFIINADFFRFAGIVGLYFTI